MTRYFQPTQPQDHPRATVFVEALASGTVVVHHLDGTASQHDSRSPDGSWISHYVKQAHQGLMREVGWHEAVLEGWVTENGTGDAPTTPGDAW